MVAAALNATEEIKQKMQRIAAHQMEVDVADVEFGDGEVRVKGAPETSMAFEDIAMAAHMAHNLPEGEQPLLLGHQVFDPPGFGWAYGVHVGVVDVDIATGQVTWGDYVVVDDCGPMVNPLIVHGQMIGGAVQAIGGALLEEVTYDESGQLVTASFMDYLMPSFHDVPKEFKVEHMITPTPFVPGGFKGVGEGGIMAPYAVAANAISDALHPFGSGVRRAADHAAEDLACARRGRRLRFGLRKRLTRPRFSSHTLSLHLQGPSSARRNRTHARREHGPDPGPDGRGLGVDPGRSPDRSVHPRR